jgi:hypothetical protein
MPTPKLTPGDPGYDWSTYSAAERDQPITDAKNFLAPYEEQDRAANRLAILAKNAPQPENSYLQNVGAEVPGMLDKAAIAGSLSHFLAPGNPVADVSNLWMAGRGAQGLYQGGVQGAIDNPLETGINAAMMLPVAGSLRGLKGAEAAGKSVAELGNPEMVKEVVNTARGLEAGGASAPRAAAQASWPLGKSSAAPSMEPSLPHSYVTKPNVPFKAPPGYGIDEATDLRAFEPNARPALEGLQDAAAEPTYQGRTWREMMAGDKTARAARPSEPRSMDIPVETPVESQAAITPMDKLLALTNFKNLPSSAEVATKTKTAKSNRPSRARKVA